MNIISNLTSRIESYRKENKNPCKSYTTESRAEKATAKMAHKAARHFGVEDAEYVVFFVEPWGRWVGAININKIISNPRAMGGYVGICTGFYTY